MDKKRILVFRVALLVAVLAIAIRLFDIQIIHYDDYVAKAAEEHISENTIPAERGEIYMMDGQDAVPVVLNSTVYAVIFDPLVVDEAESKAVLEQYAKSQLVTDWNTVFADKTKRYIVVAKNVPYSAAKQIEEAELAGVSFEQENKRVYVEGEMASGLLGFVNANGEGQYGVEGAFDEELSGTDGSLKSVRDVNGVALSIGDDNVKTPAVDGEDIVLTIDRNVQSKVEQILAQHVNDTIATNASAIVLDPKTGKVLAMANVPTYDPANYGNVKDASAYQNSVLDEAYETASVCKTFAFAAAIDLGVMNADTTYQNTGSMTVDGLTFENAYKGLYGTITMQQAFNFSLNTGSATSLKLISGGEINESGREKLYDYYYQKFGLGRYTGIELYEATGFVPRPDEYDYTMNFTYANMTFGQGMNATMLQVASAVAGIVNGGEYHVPTVVEGKIVDGQLEEAAATETRQVVNKNTSEEIRKMMYGVRAAKRTSGIDRAGYYIGGKTGTGQVVLEDGSYSEATGETIASYVGFGGAEGELPAYVVMVKIWGKDQHLEGEAHATPIFNDISNFLIDYLKIPPKV